MVELVKMLEEVHETLRKGQKGTTTLPLVKLVLAAEQKAQKKTQPKVLSKVCRALHGQ